MNTVIILQKLVAGVNEIMGLSSVFEQFSAKTDLKPTNHILFIQTDRFEIVLL